MAGNINPISLSNVVKGSGKSSILQTNVNSNISNTSGGIIVGRYNNISGMNVGVIGDGNTSVSSQNVLNIGQAIFSNGNANSLIIGNSTQMLNSDTVLSFGNNSFIQQGGSKILNFGDNNIIGPNSERIYVYGDNNYVVGSQSLTDIFIRGNYCTVSGTQSYLTLFGDNIISEDYINSGTATGMTGSYQFILNMPMVLGPSGSLPPTTPIVVTGSIPITGLTGPPHRILYLDDNGDGTTDAGFTRDVDLGITIATQSVGLTQSIFTLTATQSTFQYEDVSTSLTTLLAVTKDGTFYNGSTNPLYTVVTADSFIIIDKFFTPAANSFNMFVGAQQNGFANITIAQYNTVLGMVSGESLTSGADNILIGYQAGQNITTGNNNVFIGNQAGQGITTTGANTAVGCNAGISMVGSIGNVLIGFEAGGSITNGQDNVAIGQFAADGVISGGSNVAIGSSTGLNNDVSNCVFIGDSAGEFTSGNDNICIGAGGTDAAAFTNCIVIGSAGALATGNGQVVLGSSTNPLQITNAPVNTITPAFWLETIINGSKAYIPFYQ